MLSSLLADVGDKPLLINEVAAKSESWASYSKEIESRAGPSGFILFATIDHGAWIKKVGIRRKAVLLIIGNPTIVITMLRPNLTGESDNSSSWLIAVTGGMPRSESEGTADDFITK